MRERERGTDGLRQDGEREREGGREGEGESEGGSHDAGHTCE